LVVAGGLRHRRGHLARIVLASATPSRIFALIVFPLIVQCPRLGLPDDNDLDLSRILQLVLDPPGDRLAELGRGPVVDPLRHHHHPDLPARLDHVALLHAGIPVGDLLQPGEPLHVGLEGLAPRAGPAPLIASAAWTSTDSADSCGTSSWWAWMQLITAADSPYRRATSTPSST
jgi:hypothetical protein